MALATNLTPKIMYFLSPFDCYKALPDFAKLTSPNPTTIFNLLPNAEFWASGRSALLSIFKELKELGIDEIQMPSYICPSLPIFFKTHFKTSFYEVNSLKNTVDFSQVKREKNCAVFIINFFGNSSQSDWKTFIAQNPEVISIEDHSFAPFSDWAINSSATFSFASIRKLLPIPDGAYLVAKNRRPRLAAQRPSESISEFASEILSAMILKSIELQTANSSDASYRKKFLKGEKKLFKKVPLERISAYSFEILRKLDIPNFLEENFKKNMDFFESEDAKKLPNFVNLTSKIAKNCNSPILVFENLNLLSKARTVLLSAHSRPVLYWSDIIV